MFNQMINGMWFSTDLFHDCDVHFVTYGKEYQLSPLLDQLMIRHRNSYASQLIGSFQLNQSAYIRIDLDVNSIPQFHRFRTHRIRGSFLFR